VRSTVAVGDACTDRCSSVSPSRIDRAEVFDRPIEKVETAEPPRRVEKLQVGRREAACVIQRKGVRTASVEDLLNARGPSARHDECTAIGRFFEDVISHSVSSVPPLIARRHLSHSRAANRIPLVEQFVDSSELVDLHLLGDLSFRLASANRRPLGCCHLLARETPTPDVLS
jgi:hypothetical protein